MIALRLDAGGRVLSIARRTPPSVSIGSQFLALVFTGFEMVYSYPGALIIIFYLPCYMFSVVHSLLPLLTFLFV